MLVVTPTPIRIAEIIQPRIKRTARETMVNCEVDEVVPVVWRAVLPLPTIIVNALYITNIQPSMALTQGVLLMCILGRVSSGPGMCEVVHDWDGTLIAHPMIRRVRLSYLLASIAPRIIEMAAGRKPMLETRPTCSGLALSWVR